MAVSTKSNNLIANKLIEGVAKEFGDDAIYFARDMPPIGVVPSGSLSLDFAVGIGGLPRNRIIEFCGSEGSGKTTLALLVARNLIDDDPNRAVVYFDLEHKLTPDWMEILIGSGRMDNLLVVAPDSIEQCTEIYKRMVRSGKVSMAILDSIGGAPTNQTMDETRNFAKQADSLGGNAKGVSQFSRIAANFSAKYECLTVGINQTRDDTKSRHGNMLSTPGGHAWKHACSLRVEVRRGDEKYYVKQNDEELLVGFDVRARIIKNQLGGEEGRTAEWRFFTRATEQFGDFGIDQVEECVRLATLTGVVARNGSYYQHASFPGGQVQGKIKMLDLIQQDPATRMTLVSEVMAVLKDDPTKISTVSPLDPVTDDEDGDDEPSAPVSDVDKEVR